MPRGAKGDQAQDDPGRRESEEQRADRNLSELLQELRVATVGVQVLFGFLLSIPFTARFTQLSGAQRTLYVAILLLAAAATVLLCSPVAYHRLVFRHHEKSRLLRVANVMALAGLGMVALAITGAIVLVVSYVDAGAPAAVMGAAAILAFAGAWLVFPLLHSRRA